jgi:MFS family permease
MTASAGTSERPDGAPPRRPAHPARAIVIAFILLSLTLLLAARHAPDNPVSLMRAGGLADLVREMPIGRQSLVSSLYLMPLPTLIALPFIPFLGSAAFAYAYLYGLALLLAFATAALAALLKRISPDIPWPAAWIITIGAAYGMGASPAADLLACAALVIIALYFESARQPVLRALSGVFWGMALLTHPAGILAVALWLATALLQRLFGRRNPERNAVRWIQGLSILYAGAVYLFLNWMIMGDALYPLRDFRPVARPFEMAGRSEALSRIFREKYEGYAPVVSGQWGYLVRPFLREEQGYHFMDFYPDKLPGWEERTPVLILPAPGNPCIALCDISDPASPASRRKLDYLFLGQASGWRFYLARRPQSPTKQPVATSLWSAAAGPPLSRRGRPDAAGSGQDRKITRHSAQ